MTDATAVVFVHGAWHGPWCWSDWADAAMGGYLFQRALEEPPPNVLGAALIASVPRRGLAATTARLLRRAPRSTLRALLTADLYRAVGTQDLCRDAFFSSRTPDDTVALALQRLQNESYLAFPPMLARWPRQWADDRFDEGAA